MNLIEEIKDCNICITGNYCEQHDEITQDLIIDYLGIINEYCYDCDQQKLDLFYEYTDPFVDSWTLCNKCNDEHRKQWIKVNKNIFIYVSKRDANYIRIYKIGETK